MRVPCFPAAQPVPSPSLTISGSNERLSQQKQLGPIKSQSPNPLKNQDPHSHEKRSAGARALRRRFFRRRRRRARPCPPFRRPAPRPSDGSRQSLRPRRPQRKHRARLRLRLAAVRLLAAPQRFCRAPARSRDRRALSRRASRAGVSVATLERRLSGICWRYRQLGQPLDVRDRHIATVLAGIRRRHAPAARAKGGDLRRRAAGHAGDARHGPARPARPRDPGARLRRRRCAAPRSSASIAARVRPRTAPAGSKFLRGRRAAARSAARPAGARSRSAAARARHLPGRAARDLAAPRPDRPRAAVPADRAQERRRRRPSG